MKLLLHEIQIPERLRREAPVDDLIESLQEFGQIQPIVVSGNVLVAGYRRLKAAQALGWTEIEVVQLGDLPPERRLELEIEENTARKQLTWQEQALGILALHRAKRQTQKATARLVGISEAKLSHILRVAEALEDPKSDVWHCTCFMDAIRHLLATTEQKARRTLLERDASFLFFNGNPPRTCTWAFTWGRPFDWPKHQVVWHRPPGVSKWPLHDDFLLGWLQSPTEPNRKSTYSSIIQAPDLACFYHTLLSFLGVKQVWDAIGDRDLRKAAGTVGANYGDLVRADGAVQP